MSYIIRLHPAIQIEYNEAYEWYEDRSKGLGERFINAVRLKIGEITLNPEVYGSKGIKNSEKRW